MRLLIIITIFIFSLPSLAKALEVSPDGPLIVNLQNDAATVIVGNPAHAAVNLITSKMLVITAGLPGVTNLTVLGADGSMILNEKVVVNGAADGYVRIKNACINAEGECEDTKMFYCEDGASCHNVIVATEPPAESGSVGGGL